MFIRLVTTLVFASLLATQVWAIDEGIDYTELRDPQPMESGDQIEVLEVFMYSCPHCFYLEPSLKKWLATKPDQVVFRRMPAIFGAKVEPHAQAFYAAELLEAGDSFGQALFEALHVKRQAIWEEEDLVALAESIGLDGTQFRQAYHSFFVRMKVNRAKELGSRYGIDGVPTLIINGKYRTSPSQTGGRDKMMQVLDSLIRLESEAASNPAGGRTQPAPAASAAGES